MRSGLNPVSGFTFLWMPQATILGMATVGSSPIIIHHPGTTDLATGRTRMKGVDFHHHPIMHLTLITTEVNETTWFRVTQIT